jgi:hypothetical protein
VHVAGLIVQPGEEYGRHMEIAVFIVVVVVLFAFAWGRLRSGGVGDPEDLDPRTSRRQMDKQFKKPPNEGGLL